MSASPSDAEFIARTHEELTRLSAEAHGILRARPNHPWCQPGPGCCRVDAAYYQAHARIDDHLYQLEGADPVEHPLEPWRAAVLLAMPVPETATQAKMCGCCGHARFSNFKGATICGVCDGQPVGDQEPAP